MPQNNKKIRVAILGDEKVGKTSFITTLISESLPEKLEKVIGPVLLPPEMCPQAFDVTTIIIDTSSDPKLEFQVNQELKESNVLVLLYDIARIETIERLQTFWMPKIKKISEKTPVIVVGNKIDLENEINESQMERAKISKVIKSLVKEFKQVEVGLECSALKSSNISEVIYCAQRVVLFPLAPLYDFTEKNLTVDFRKALTRIFRIVDKDCDNFITDDELNCLQLDVFKGELTQEDIKGIKDVIKDENENIDNGITLNGFMILQKKCIVEFMKFSICWSILRHFGYDDGLSLKGHFFRDNEDEFKQASALALSSKSMDFLTGIFKRFSEDDGMTLKIAKFKDIFYPMPDGSIPWNQIENLIPLENAESLRLDGWLALWGLMTYFDYKNAYNYLIGIGFDNPIYEAFSNLSKNHLTYSQICKLSKKNIVHIGLIGPPNSGKSYLMDKFLKKNDEHDILYSPTMNSKSCANYIVFQSNSSKKLVILTEIPKIEIESENVAEIMKKLDLLGIVYKRDLELEEFLIKNAKFIGKKIPAFLINIRNFAHEEIKKDKINKLGFKESCFISRDSAGVVPQMMNSAFQLMEKPSRGLSSEIVEELKRADSFLQRNYEKIGFTLFLASTFTIIAFYLGGKKNLPFLSFKKMSFYG